MIRGVLFDKDGTLLEFHSTQHSIYSTLLACLKDDYQVPDQLLQQLSETLGHLPDRLTPDSLLQFSTNQQVAQALFGTCRSYAEERGWQRPFDSNDLPELIDALAATMNAFERPSWRCPRAKESLSGASSTAGCAN